MSLVALLGDLLDDYRRPSLTDLYDQHFGLGLLNDDDITPTSTILRAPLRSGYLRPWRGLSASDSGVSSIQSDKREFRINLDVQQFKPEELKVRVADGFIVVDGKHEERSDEHGFVSRQFTRKYKIPQDVDDASLTSSLSSDGVLALKARKRGRPEDEGKEIPIAISKEPAMKKKKQIRENGSEEKMEQ